jgi:hypothetical protein
MMARRTTVNADMRVAFSRQRVGVCDVHFLSAPTCGQFGRCAASAWIIWSSSVRHICAEFLPPMPHITKALDRPFEQAIFIQSQMRTLLIVKRSRNGS